MDFNDEGRGPGDDTGVPLLDGWGLILCGGDLSVTWGSMCDSCGCSPVGPFQTRQLFFSLSVGSWGLWSDHRPAPVQLAEVRMASVKS